MTPEEQHKWIETCSLEDLVKQVIWEHVMSGTAWCGWTHKARESLVESVQEGVLWAIDYKKDKL